MTKLGVVIALWLLVATPATQVVPLATAVVDIAAALGDTAAVVGKFAESLRKGPGAGVPAYERVAARRAADRLREIGRQAAILPMAQPSSLVDAVERSGRAAWERFEREAVLAERRLRGAVSVWSTGSARVALPD
jgi:hypothetical protein